MVLEPSSDAVAVECVAAGKLATFFTLLALLEADVAVGLFFRLFLGQVGNELLSAATTGARTILIHRETIGKEYVTEASFSAEHLLEEALMRILLLRLWALLSLKESTHALHGALEEVVHMLEGVDHLRARVTEEPSHVLRLGSLLLLLLLRLLRLLGVSCTCEFVGGRHLLCWHLGTSLTNRNLLRLLHNVIASAKGYCHRLRPSTVWAVSAREGLLLHPRRLSWLLVSLRLSRRELTESLSLLGLLVGEPHLRLGILLLWLGLRLRLRLSLSLRLRFCFEGSLLLKEVALTV